MEKNLTVEKEMTIAAAGKIQQAIVRDTFNAEAWALDKNIVFNVQLLNAAVFPSVLGLPAPPTPINAATYKKYGYPFFKMYEEMSGIHGDFGGVLSCAELDKNKGKKRSRDDSEELDFDTVVIRQHGGKKSCFTPVSKMVRDLQDINVVSKF